MTSGFGDLLGAEGLRRREVLAVVVAEVVVADDGGGFDAGPHQEVHQHRLVGEACTGIGNCAEIIMFFANGSRRAL